MTPGQVITTVILSAIAGAVTVIYMAVKIVRRCLRGYLRRVPHDN